MKSEQQSQMMQNKHKRHLSVTDLSWGGEEVVTITTLFGAVIFIA